MAHFAIPHIDDNPEGWGPSSVPEKFKDIPYYAPFHKGDKLGKAADWQQQYTGKTGKYQRDVPSAVSTIFSWYYQDDDASFQLVDNTKTQKKYGARKFQKGYQQVRQTKQQGQQGSNWQQQKQQGQKKQQFVNKFQQRRWGQPDPGARKRDPSIQVQESWTLVEEIDFGALGKVSEAEPVAEDLAACGYVEPYNKANDLITTRSDVMLERTERAFFHETTSDDPVIRKLSLDSQGTVFATDTILSHLMACGRSVIPWDIIITKSSNKLFFDKREGSILDYLTVNETTFEPPSDDSSHINSATSLMKEATFINQNFSQQVLNKKDKKFSFAQPNPFQQEGGPEPAAVGYKYRKWKLADDIILVARCEVDGYVEGKVSPSFLTIKSLNEYDPKLNDWRKKIDAQRGAVAASEQRNNAFKLAKWTTQALLAGTDTIKLGFVSRMSPKDLSNHQILAVADYKPKEFALQMNLNLKNAWGTLKRIIEVCMKQPAGKYILMKDPERGALKLYSVPEDNKSVEK